VANYDRAPLRVGSPLKIDLNPDQSVLKVGRGASAQKLPGRWQDTDATRYLCARAYLTRLFRNHVIQHLMEHKHQALASSWGIDPVTIVKHSLVARRIGRIRDLLLVVPVLVALLGLMIAPAAPLGFFLLLFIGLAGAFGIIAWERWKVEFNIVRRNFTKKNFNPGVQDHRFDHEAEQSFREIEEAQQSNVVIYSAFSPFVGCGTNVGTWPLAVDVTKGKEELGSRTQPRSFKVEELYTSIAEKLRSLDFPNCSVENKLCISGLDVRDDKFLPDIMARPRTQIDENSMESYIAHPTNQARHYQSFRLVDWSGELVLTTFLRAAQSGGNLFIEGNYCMLAPIDDAYRVVDSMNPVPSLRDWARLLVQSAFKTVLIWPFWAAYILEILFSPLHRWLHEREIRKMIRENPAFNHGASESLREYACRSNVYRRYFQKLDKERYMRILDNQVLDCIAQFLDARGIDTSELKRTQQLIVNSGIIVSGGSSVEATSLAVGQGSQATHQSSPSGAVKFIRELANRAGAGH
jgi:hypothetical protein